jgi:hypothetical protein
MLHRWRKQLPCRGMFLFAELCDQSCICFVRFVAVQFALSIAFDARRVDHTNLKTSLKKEFGDFFPIVPGGFQAGKQLPRAVGMAVSPVQRTWP